MSKRLSTLKSLQEGGRSFGREVAESASNRLDKIFKTGKIEEDRYMSRFTEKEGESMKEIKVGDIVDIIEFRKYEKKAKVTEIGKIRGGYFAGRPFVSAYQSWGNDHAPGSTAGHNFCFMKSVRSGEWVDLDADALLDPKYWPYLDSLFGYMGTKTREFKEFIEKEASRRVTEANSGFKPLRELLDSLVGPEDYADFLEYASEYGYDFEYEDPNAIWPVAEIQELVDCYYGGEDFGGYFGDPELHMEYDDETGDINLDMAYSDWIKSYAPNYDISNEDAWRAGVELAGGVYDEASGQKYSEWVESFAPNYDVSNKDAFTAGFKSIVEDPEITCFESATPYKERGVRYERRGR